jgi:hypothetical protein
VTKTRAHATPCPSCGATTIRGLTHPPGAYQAITDPVPLTMIAEAAALLKGKLTYDLVSGITGHHELIRRDQHRIKQRDWPVLATHQCPGPVPWTPPRPPVEEIQPHEIPY